MVSAVIIEKHRTDKRNVSAVRKKSALAEAVKDRGLDADSAASSINAARYGACTEKIINIRLAAVAVESRGVISIR